MILDFLTGQKYIDRIQKQGENYAKAAYNPNQARPMIEEGQRRASEGIDVDSLTQQLMSEVYKGIPRRTTGISQGQQLAAEVVSEGNRTDAMASGTNRIGMMDEQAKEEGKAMQAQGLTQAQQLKAKRDAGIAESRMMAEAEAGKRRQALLGGVVNLASAAIGGGTGGMLSFIQNFKKDSQSQASVNPEDGSNRLLYPGGYGGGTALSIIGQG